MLTKDIKRTIDNARDVLVGKIPNPQSQIEQITIAMIYKFMDDMDLDSVELGGERQFFVDELSEYAWSKIMSPQLGTEARMNLYTEALDKLQLSEKIPQLFRNIFKGSYLPFRDGQTLTLFLKEINDLSYNNSENLGNGFEYLLSIMGSQGDAGQFRTPRHIIDFIVDVVKPTKTDTILDPACGTAGFLISAYKFIMQQAKNSEQLLTPKELKDLTENIQGYDISPDMQKLALVNMYLHRFKEPKIYEYDTLTSQQRWDDYFDCILANPPFMTPKGGIQPHNRFGIKANKSEILFADYILEHTNSTGKGAFVVPEGIIANTTRPYIELRKKMIDSGVYAVIGLHPYVFKPYSGVSTLIIFFDKRYKNKKEMYLKMIENDGFEKGENRMPITENDLPCCINELNMFLNYLNGDSKIDLNTFTGTIIQKDNCKYNLDFHPYSYYKEDDAPNDTIDNIFNIEKGYLQSSKREEGCYNFITAADNWLTHCEYTHNCEALVFVYGAGGSLGKVHYVNGKFIASDLCFILTPKNKTKTNIKYYYSYFNTNRTSIVKRLARGTNKKAINEERFRNYRISAPNKIIQDKTGDEVARIFKNIELLKLKIQDEYSKISTLIH